jgi:ABC-type multidrug transport system fused ATPase/permease subunit
VISHFRSTSSLEQQTGSSKRRTQPWHSTRRYREQSEKAVMDAVSNLAHQKTIIIIAHRLSTVRTCDEIIMLEQGRLEAKGSYEELFKENHRFRAMTEAHH